MNISHEITAYSKDLEDYIEQARLPKEWFGEPDHIAIKAGNNLHYELLLSQIDQGEPRIEYVTDTKRVKWVSETRMDGRRIAVVNLAGPVAVGSQWAVKQIEVMEPRPEMVGKDRVGVDHMEFLQLDLKQVEERLEHIVGVVPNIQRKPYHNSLSLTFGPQNRELKFTDKRLADVIKQELITEEAEIIYQNSR